MCPKDPIVVAEVAGSLCWPALEIGPAALKMSKEEAILERPEVIKERGDSTQNTLKNIDIRNQRFVRVIKNWLRQSTMKTCQWKRSCKVGHNPSADD